MFEEVHKADPRQNGARARRVSGRRERSPGRALAGVTVLTLIAMGLLPGLAYSGNDVVGFWPVDDAKIRAGENADMNHNGQGIVTGQGIPNWPGGHVESLLKFDLGGLPQGQVLNAKLRMFLYDDGSWDTTGTVYVHLADHDNWQEETLTWNNAPGPDYTEPHSVAIGSQSGPIAISYPLLGPIEVWEFELDPSVVEQEASGDGILSVRLVPDGTYQHFARFHDKEMTIQVFPGITSTLPPTLSVVVEVLSTPSTAEREVAVRVVTKWDSSCDGETRSKWAEMVKGWSDAIADNRPAPVGHGPLAWDQKLFKKNGSIVDSDFTDSDEVSWGKDHKTNRLDDVDVYMVGLHGNESWGYWGEWTGSARVNESGWGPDCEIEQEDMVLGDRDLEFLHLSSCHSMCDDNWWDWNSTFDGLHQINGFHGIMPISGGRKTLYAAFADAAFDVAIADAWLDEMDGEVDYADDDEDTIYDVCPVSRGIGATEDDLWFRLDHERYDNVLTDPVSNDANSREHGVIYLKGCDPKGDSALPD